MPLIYSYVSRLLILEALFSFIAEIMVISVIEFFYTARVTYNTMFRHYYLLQGKKKPANFQTLKIPTSRCCRALRNRSFFFRMGELVAGKLGGGL